MKSGNVYHRTKFWMPSNPIRLALLWGHLPRGIVRCSRNICQRPERETLFALARNSSSGRKAETLVSSFGEFHLDTSQGPRPVSLVEISSSSETYAPSESVSFLHCISLGYPVVGERIFSVLEKFYDPVLPSPEDLVTPYIQDWLGPGGSLIREDEISQLLREFQGIPKQPSESRLHNLSVPSERFPGEDSTCRYVDHPAAVSVRRDRG